MAELDDSIMNMSAARHFLIVGLGNYTHPFTRHSVGQVLVDGLAERLGITMSQDRSVTGWIGSKQLVFPAPLPKGKKKQSEEEPLPPIPVTLTLLKPKLLMNISGKSVSLALRQNIKPPSSKSVVVIHDSLEHKPFGVSPKAGGSANGHNGIKSTIQALGTNDFHRIRLGIGRPNGAERGDDVSSYVLQKMTDVEMRYWRDAEGDGVARVWEEIEKIVTR